MAVSDDDITEAALAPKSTTQDGKTVVERDIRELREAQKNQAVNNAASNPFFGLRIGQMVTKRPAESS